MTPTCWRTWIHQELDQAEGKPDRLLLYVDQWEELYAQGSSTSDKESSGRHCSRTLRTSWPIGLSGSFAPPRPKKNAASSSRNASSHPFVMVVGRSGSGKSSLVYAGLLPPLRRERDRFWNVLTLRPGPTPLRALAAAFNPRTENEGAAE